MDDITINDGQLDINTNTDIQNTTTEIVNIDYSEQLDHIINIQNNILGVNFVFMNFFILFCICALIHLFFKNF